jgi:hypothetical protein
MLKNYDVSQEENLKLSFYFLIWDHNFTSSFYSQCIVTCIFSARQRLGKPE